MKKLISEATRHAVLDAAWDLLADHQRPATLSEVAAAAGVSRQTLFYAFGNRAGLLVAMVRHRDALGPHADRMKALAEEDAAGANALHA